MKLNEVQSLFKQQVFSSETDPKILREFKPAGPLSLDQAFKIYHNAYIARLTEALRETFPAVFWVLGEDLFKKVASKYIQTQPSVSYVLTDYGVSFPEFLRLTPQGKGAPFLFDLARLEWSYKNLLHASSPEPLPTEQVQALIHSEDFKVQFIDAMEVFESPYSVFEIWSRRWGPAYEFETINWQNPESLLLYKKQKKVQVQKIDKIEAQVLTELQEGSSVSSALADYSSLLTPDRIAQLFQLMMRTGVIEDLIVLDT